MTLIVAAHDAGGAEVVSSWLLQEGVQARCVLEGPAVAVFERKLGAVQRVDRAALAVPPPGAGFVLTGTSQVSDLERRMIDWAHRCGIRCAAFLDHWVGYRNRFTGRLPDEIWVGDRHAYERALAEGFGRERLRLVPNPYLSQMSRRIRRRPDEPRRGKIRLLYICEPISQEGRVVHGDPEYFGFTELTLVDELMQWYRRHGRHYFELRVRPHPAEGPDKYRSVLRDGNDRVRLSQDPDVGADLQWADWVVGIESMALALAAEAGKRVFSYIPTDRYVCHLPHGGVRSIRRFKELVDYA